jgi:hypothetical protein
MLEQIAYLVIGAIMSAFTTIVIIKLTVNSNKIIEISQDFLDEIAVNTELQRKIYILGVLLGNGIRSGIGIGGKGGKFKFEDVIGQGLATLFQSMFGKTEQSEIPRNPLAER